MGFNMSPQAISVAVRRYSSKGTGQIEFDDFVACSLRINHLSKNFRARDQQGQGWATLRCTCRRPPAADALLARSTPRRYRLSAALCTDVPPTPAPPGPQTMTSCKWCSRSETALQRSPLACELARGRRRRA